MNLSTLISFIARKLFGKKKDARHGAEVVERQERKADKLKDNGANQSGKQGIEPQDQDDGDGEEEIHLALHVVRGLPGSGKTMIARKLASLSGAVFIEADQAAVKAGEYATPERKLREIYGKLMPLHLANIMTSCLCDGIYSDVLPTKEDLIRVVKPINQALKEKGVKLILNVVDAPIADVRESFEMSQHYDNMAEIKELCDAFVPFKKMDFKSEDVD